MARGEIGLQPVTPLRPLPIAEILPALIAALRGSPCAVVRAPTGAGKTTRVPPALLDAGLAGDGRIVMLEPRRVAARAAARWMAGERGGEVGGEVGYQVRFDRRAGSATRILVVTEGILVQMLQADPFLEGIGALVFDEFHERRLDSDLALAMARRVQREARPELRLVVMSATLETGPVAEFLGGCPVVESAGRLHSVAVEYADPADRRLARGADDRFHDPGPPRPSAIAARAARGVLRAFDRTQGDVLVFLPGVGEIRRAADLLAGTAGERDLALVPLYGDLPGEEQDAALSRGPRCRRRVVLATNVAETSITVEGIGAVVDAGWARQLRYDPASGLDRLELVRISRASADQRAGRAGREGPGTCFRLWTQHDHMSRPEREVPEVRRVDLAGPALQLLAWGEPDPAAFGWFEPPVATALGRALELLAALGAVDATGITAAGRAMASLPVHPRLARLLVEGHRLGVSEDAALIAALLAERAPFVRGDRPAGDGAVRPSRSDLVDMAEAVAAFARDGRPTATARGRINPGAARFVLRARDQLAELVRRRLGGDRGTAAPPAPAGRADAQLRAVFAAYPDRLARRREPGSPRALTVGGRGVRLAAESAVREADLFVCVDVDAGAAGRQREGAEALVRTASAVERDWLPADRLHIADEMEFDAARERVVARRRTRFADLVVDEREVPLAADDEAADVLAAAAAAQLDRALALNEERVAAFLARLRCLAEWRPELALPRFGEDELRGLLPALCRGRRSFAELRRAPLLDILRGSLSYEQLAALDREAPERLEVPSGSRIRLAYEPGRPPVLASRIQELFGLAETPRLAGGRVPVLLHLLAPNGRPQQVTDDLASFWERTYPEVRKELAGRYPKHAWPADPRTAEPERRPQRR